jgi:hypothetical protein
VATVLLLLPRSAAIRGWISRSLCICIGLALALDVARGQGFVPYGTDAGTLHLWHLKETGVPAADSVGGRFTLPLQGLIDGAALTGSNAVTGLAGSALMNTGTAVSGIILPGTSLTGTGVDLPFSLADPTTGAFTFEAVIQFHPSYNPLTDTSGRNMQLLAADDNGSGPRIFQFRYLAASGATPAQLQLVNIPGTTQTLGATIPTTGSNAMDNVNWFHVAVTYDPVTGGTANMKFYWTKLTPATTAANLIGTGSMVSPLVVPIATGTFNLGVLGAFSIGNRVRALTTSPSSGFVGYIDEVRVSRIARSGTAMMPSNYDSAGSGLPDAWQMKYFGHTGVSPSADADGDGYTNLQEYLAGSDPTNANSTPLDIDANGLPDAWELQYFGYIGVNGSADPDGDGYTNLQEYAGGSDPTNPLSNPGNISGSALPDAWQLQYYGHLGVDPNALSPNGDWFTNIEEYRAGTNPISLIGPHPPGPKVRLIPVTDGTDVTSSGYAYSGASGINAIAFECSTLRTYGSQQFMAFYGRHATSSTYTYNNTIWLARRNVGAMTWQVFRTIFTANDITDGHDIIAFGIDGEGYMHISWGMHNASGSSFHYTRSLTPVTGTNAIAFAPDAHNMTGNENVLTYPQFLQMPNGDLLYLYRVGDPATGGSGSGDQYFNRYSLATHAWSNVDLSGTTPMQFTQGIPWNPNYNAYPNMPCVDAAGNLFMTWTWRFTAGFESNENVAFASSSDYGVTWQRTTGSNYTLPINFAAENGNPNSQCETVYPLPQNFSQMNASGMCLDLNDQPVVANWWAPLTASGNYERQYMVLYPAASGTTWTARQISNRTVDPTNVELTDSWVRDLARPVALCDKQGRLIIIYRDDHSSGGLTVAYSQTPASDPQRMIWNTIDLTTDNLGGFEPVVDITRWQSDNTLEVLYQASPYAAYSGLTSPAPANSASPIGVLEWDEPAYFSAPALNVTINGRDAVLAWNSVLGMGYQLWTSTDLRSWTALGTFVGADRTRLTYTHTGGATGPKRFWKLEMKEGSF